MKKPLLLLLVWGSAVAGQRFDDRHSLMGLAVEEQNAGFEIKPIEELPPLDPSDAPQGMGMRDGEIPPGQANPNTGEATPNKAPVGPNDAVINPNDAALNPNAASSSANGIVLKPLALTPEQRRKYFEDSPAPAPAAISATAAVLAPAPAPKPSPMQTPRLSSTMPTLSPMQTQRLSSSALSPAPSAAVPSAALSPGPAAALSPEPPSIPPATSVIPDMPPQTRRLSKAHIASYLKKEGAMEGYKALAREYPQILDFEPSISYEEVPGKGMFYRLYVNGSAKGLAGLCAAMSSGGDWCSVAGGAK
ncbi:MAG: hypothetical protein LBH41_01355 [Rickettsiales bacterium]|nr:hypothetical protein [Rickettsiales bacterium]